MVWTPTGAHRGFSLTSLMDDPALAQAGVMNIDKCKCTSASPRASQLIADGHFVHS